MTNAHERGKKHADHSKHELNGELKKNPYGHVIRYFIRVFVCEYIYVASFSKDGVECCIRNDRVEKNEGKKHTIQVKGIYSSQSKIVHGNHICELKRGAQFFPW